MVIKAQMFENTNSNNKNNKIVIVVMKKWV